MWQKYTADVGFGNQNKNTIVTGSNLETDDPRHWGEENVSFKHLTVHIASLLNFSPLNLKHRKYHTYALILIQQSACLNVSAHPLVKCIRPYYIEEL